MKKLLLLFFPLAFLYEELLLRVYIEFPLGDYHLIFIAGFALVYGLFAHLLLSLLRSDKARLVWGSVLLAVTAAVFSTEYCVYSFFRNFFEVSTMLSMGGAVTSQFADETNATILAAIPYILLSFIPLVLFWLLRKPLLSAITLTYHEKVHTLFTLLLVDILLIVPMVLGASFKADRDFFLYDYTAAGSVPRFGIMTTLRMEATYAVTGIPQDFLVKPMEDITQTEPVQSEEGPVVYGYNVQDIDFTALYEGETDKNLKSMHSYFGNMAPTQKNEYTGMFAGKNLVFLVCEAFCPSVIDPELTPTLYKLSTEGFVFNNFYQPDWTQSTFGGEFSAVSGIVPTWIGGTYSFTASADNLMPYTMGNQFRRLGYTTAAYHNHHYNYYDRDKTHPNLGYDYYGVGQGLDMGSRAWPASDHDMLQITMPQYIDAYVNSGENFHVYYMTVSGHTGYNFYGNKQSIKHEKEVEHLKYSETVRAYLACQLEVEYALTYLIQALEEAGIADDTVIALTSDHYPYALTRNFEKDYYKELTGNKKLGLMDIERFENKFLLWSASMEAPVVIDTPASTIDIIPTLSNLFGLDYDSRLLSGRDILSTNYDITDPNSRQPFVVFPDMGSGQSWVATVGEYDGNTGKFTPYEGYEDYKNNTEYLEAMHKKAKNMFKYAKQLVSQDYYQIIANQVPALAATPTPAPAEVPAVTATPSPTVTQTPVTSMPPAA